MMDVNKDIAPLIRSRILVTASKSGEGHVPSSLSVVEAICASILFLDSKKLSPRNFVLSKGHAALGLFSCLVELGHIPTSDLDGYADEGSSFGGHPDSLKSPHIALSSGSLGHGLAFAAGLAHFYRLGGTCSPVIVLVGDGELNEGSNWEAMLLAVKLELSNLVVLVDDNRSTSRALDLGDLERKFQAFGIRSSRMDGHEVDELIGRISDNLADKSNQPSAIILNTTKGKGVRQMEEEPDAWHHRPPNKAELEEFLKQVSR